MNFPELALGSGLAMYLGADDPRGTTRFSGAFFAEVQEPASLATVVRGIGFIAAFACKHKHKTAEVFKVPGLEAVSKPSKTK